MPLDGGLYSEGYANTSTVDRNAGSFAAVRLGRQRKHLRGVELNRGVVPIHDLSSGMSAAYLQACFRNHLGLDRNG
jgi:hypothetical protein